MIRQAKKSDVNVLINITKECTKLLRSKNIFQWNEQYPNYNAFNQDVLRNELYVLESNNGIIGSITISKIMDLEYKDVEWLSPNLNNCYLHRLAIHPNHQGKGHARELMDFAEDFAKIKGFTSIRLDTFSKNLRNQKFYELRGYKKLGVIYFPEQSEHPFFCYELVL